MTQTRGLKLLLISSAFATFGACGGGSMPESPTESPTQATQTAGVAGQTTAASDPGAPPGTPGPGGGSGVAGASPATVPPPGVTALPDGTATKAERTPLTLRTVERDGSAATPGAQATAGVSTGAVISIAAAAPADAGGDFVVNVKLDGVTKPYVAFNVYVTFDPTILTATAIRPGTALAPTPDETFCVRSPAAPGAVRAGMHRAAGVVDRGERRAGHDQVPRGRCGDGASPSAQRRRRGGNDGHVCRHATARSTAAA